jgi:hypothetical protein
MNADDLKRYAAMLGRKGGQAGKGKTTTAKATAARANGKKGGRPRGDGRGGKFHRYDVGGRFPKRCWELLTDADGYQARCLQPYGQEHSHQDATARDAVAQRIAAPLADCIGPKRLTAAERFAAHQSADPHCTCNDCMADFIGGQSDDLRRTE